MTVSKPTEFPRFASVDLLNGTGGAPNVVEPSSLKKDSGWFEGERPPRETFNWLHRITNDWLVYLDCAVLPADNQFAQDTSLTVNLDFAVGPGKATVRGDEQEIAVATVLGLVDDAVNFVFYEPSSNTVSFVDEATVPAELDGGKDVIPLFRVTTAGGSITDVEDLRTWLVIPSVNYSELDQHEIRTAGLAFERDDLTGLTPTPDVSVSNIFRVFVSGSDNVVIQDAISVESLSPTQTDIIYFLLEFDAGATGDIQFSSQYEFFNTSGVSPTLTPGSGQGPTNDEFVVKAIWDADNNHFRCELLGGTSPFPGVNGAKAFGSSSITIGNATLTTVALNSEAFDTLGIHDNAVNNSRLTVPTGVTRIKLTAMVKWQNNANGYRRLEIRKNGAGGSIDDDQGGYNPVDVNSAGGVSLEHANYIDSGIIRTAPGDFFEIRVDHSAGGNLDILGGEFWFQMEIIE